MRLFTLFAFLFLKMGRIDAQSGTLDPEFGMGGWVHMDFGGKDQSGCVAIQSDGKILVGGRTNGASGSFDFILVRYTSMGQLDLSFGDMGKVIMDFGSTQENIEFIHCLPDKKILIGGYSNLSPNTQSVVVRLTEEGKPDTSFGDQGILKFKYGRSTGVLNMALQEDGKYVFGCIGIIDTFGVDIEYVLSRYFPDGKIDSSFNQKGWTYYDFNTRENIPFDLLIQRDQKILLSGCSGVYPKANFAFVRYKPDGSLDSLFGIDGAAQTDFAGNQDVAYTSIIQEDGSFYVSGTVRDSITNYDFALAKYLENGSLDTTFGNKGKLTYDFKGPVDYGLYMRQQKDGKLLICGENNILTKNSFVVARFNKDGSLDPAFGIDGLAGLNVINILTDDTPSFTLQEDEKIVMVGNYKDGNNVNFLIMRFLNDINTATNNEKKSSVSIVPNPVERQINLVGLQSGFPLKCSIFHINGNLIQQESFDQTTENWSLSLSKNKTWPSGYYFLKVEQGSGQIVLPFFKK